MSATLIDQNKSTCPVNSHNEWDLLEEVIVGVVDYAVLPSWDTINRFTVPPGEWAQAAFNMAGKPGNRYPETVIEAAQHDLEYFVQLLESEGVKVRRPDIIDYMKPFATPDWSVDSGFCAANPRDVFLVVGNEIIESPMADRSRYFESWAYRRLLKEYFRAGARWTAAPKPQLLDALYDHTYQVPDEDETNRFIITEFEPTFDAADFVRCGRDIFCQKSHVTNDMGIMWLQHHLGDDYCIHVLDSLDRQAIHIDTSFMPLAPGKVLVNPEYQDIRRLPDVLKTWDILVAPPPNDTPTRLLGMLSPWISVNVLSLDGERIIVEQSQERLIRALRDWGFKPIPVQFKHYYPFAGAFHCATLDVRRRGHLQSYL